MSITLPLRRTARLSRGALVRPLVLGVVTGLAAFALGSVSAAEAATAAVSGLVQEGSSAVSLAGPWTSLNSTQAVGGSFANLNATGSASLTFNGTGISWIARRNAHSGIATVTLDGRKVATVNLYAASTTYRTAVYTTRSLAAGRHTIKVVRTGQRSAASDGSNVVVDAFNVLDKRAPLAPTSVAVGPARTGARLTWAQGTETDLATYRVDRTNPSGATVRVGTVSGTTTSFFDAGLPAGATYRYRVSAVDTSGNVSASSATVSLSVPAAAPYAAHRFADCPTATVQVATMTQLQAAVNAAGPGAVIALAPGYYVGPLEVAVTGTAAEPVWICGPRTAVVQGWGPTKPGGVRVKDSSHVVIAGLTVR
ncbi:MAG: fibronectin type protein, partial [Friedmanniella sp.]|nr:fibronectin type protein [Friedmanniella sp.]